MPEARSTLRGDRPTSDEAPMTLAPFTGPPRRNAALVRLWSRPPLELINAVRLNSLKPTMTVWSSQVSPVPLYSLDSRSSTIRATRLKPDSWMGPWSVAHSS